MMKVSSLEFEDTSSGRARRTNATTFVICGCARHAFNAPPPMVPVAPVRRTFIARASLEGLQIELMMIREDGKAFGLNRDGEGSMVL